VLIPLTVEPCVPDRLQWPWVHPGDQVRSSGASQARCKCGARGCATDASVRCKVPCGPWVCTLASRSPLLCAVCKYSFLSLQVMSCGRAAPALRVCRNPCAFRHKGVGCLCMVSRSIVPLDGEVWKDIQWTGCIYQVSNIGRVRRTGGWCGHQYCCVLALKRHPRGYPFVNLQYGGNDRGCTVHSLVAEAFIGPRPYQHQVNHKNGNKLDNNVSNLEYVTPSENSRHALRTGLYRPPHGSEHCNAKLTEKKVCQIRSMLKHASIAKVAEMFHVSTRTIHGIKIGASWKHVIV